MVEFRFKRWYDNIVLNERYFASKNIGHLDQEKIRHRVLLPGVQTKANLWASGGKKRSTYSLRGQDQRCGARPRVDPVSGDGIFVRSSFKNSMQFCIFTDKTLQSYVIWNRSPRYVRHYRRAAARHNYSGSPAHPGWWRAVAAMKTKVKVCIAVARRLRVQVVCGHLENTLLFKFYYILWI
jgi:hypothetical protein